MAVDEKKEEEKQSALMFLRKGTPLLAGDLSLWMIIIILMFASLLVVYSATNSKAYAEMGGDTSYFLYRQLGFMILGLFIIIVVHRINYQVYAWFANWLFIAAVILQILTFFIGRDANSAKRAIYIFNTGLTIQPSDFLKVALAMVLARHLAARQSVIDKLKLFPRLIWFKRSRTGVTIGMDAKRDGQIMSRATIPLIIVPMLIPFALVMPSNFSTASIIAASCVLTLLIGRARWQELVRISIIMVVSLILIINIMAAMDIARGKTWKNRILDFFRTEQVVQDADDDKEQQAMKGKIAIASGGITGKGPGRSTMRASLAHSYSDFAYAFIVEEYGLAGGIVVVLLYLWLFYRTIVIFQRCGTAYPSLLVLGLGLMIFLQAAVNMVVSVGLSPVTGQNLPLISMGGTSAIFISLALGMILGVSRQMQEKSLDNPKGESLLGK